MCFERMLITLDTASQRRGRKSGSSALGCAGRPRGQQASLGCTQGLACWHSSLWVVLSTDIETKEPDILSLRSHCKW